MLIVTVVKDKYDDMNTGVEVAGIFDTKEKAYSAEMKIVEWLNNNGYKDGEVMICNIETNQLVWYEMCD